MDLLLKWSPAHEDDTCDQHRATAAAEGSTWWGCWSSSETRGIAADRLELLERQLTDGVQTRAFVFRLGPEPELWQATVLALAEDDSAIDRSHRPADMSFEGCFLFVELSDFTLLEPDWAERRLALCDRPDDGAVPHGALHNQTSPIYVFELP